jgi:hypothetical protein
MDGTIIQQGTFVGTDSNIILNIRSDVDWMWVYNYTNIGGAVANQGTQFYWQRGFAVNDGIVYFHAAGTQVISMSTAAVGIGGGAIPGFTLVDSSAQTTGAATALTAISTAATPRVTVASTALLRTNDVVRLTNIVGAPQFSGLDFTITVIDGTHFDLEGAPQLAVAATAGFYRKVNFDPVFYPPHRVIGNITRAAQGVVVTLVNHLYKVGQQIRFSIPAIYGMTELNNVLATIVAIPDDISFTIDIDTSGFTAFTFPLAGDVPFTPAQVTPVGENTSIALAEGVDILGDATVNENYIGMILGAGAASPGGEDDDVIYWVAGKSFSNMI